VGPPLLRLDVNHDRRWCIPDDVPYDVCRVSHQDVIELVGPVCAVPCSTLFSGYVLHPSMPCLALAVIWTSTLRGRSSKYDIRS
jgi:hypothetical protein